MYIQHYSYFHSAFKELQVIIKSHIPERFSKTLQRIHDGYKYSFNNFMQRIKLVRKNGEDIAGVLSDKLKELTSEFEEYKVKNNIDTYFSKFVDR